MGTAIKMTFDEAAHEYRANGVVVPSVTQVLKSLGYADYSMVPLDVLERKRQIGSLVHQACHFYDEGDFDESDFDKFPVVKKRFEAYKKFRTVTGYVPHVNEGRQIGELFGMRYGMQFDSIGKVGKQWWLVDIKNASGGPQRGWGIQTAAYAMGQKVVKVQPHEFVRVIVQLTDDEGFSGENFRIFSSNDSSSKIFRKEDFGVWQACLCVAIDKQNSNIH